MNEHLQPLLSFKDQFQLDPVLHNKEHLDDYDNIVVCGMGGSGIAVSFLKLLFPNLPFSLHNSYGLPRKPASSTLVVVNSYSGNTEEALDSFTRAQREGLDIVAISKGGKLLELAKEKSLPYIELPESGFEPRFAIGHQMMALLTVANEQEKIKMLRKAVELMGIEKGVEAGNILASRFANKYPVLYSSPLLLPLTYPIKAAVNEGAKLPAFVNVISEANHNELQGFVVDENRSESNSFGFLFFISSFDDERIKKRINIMRELYEARGFICEEIIVDHSSPSSLLDALFLGYAFATSLATLRDVNPYTTPFIQEFKKRMSN